MEGRVAKGQGVEHSCGDSAGFHRVFPVHSKECLFFEVKLNAFKVQLSEKIRVFPGKDRKKESAGIEHETSVEQILHPNVA
jgi:hypothetical protein